MMSSRSAILPRSSSAGGHELQPWLVKSSTTTGDVCATARSAHADSDTSIAVQYSSTLETWVTATHDGDNVIITPTNDHYGAGVDRVEVKLKRSLEENGRIFSRLEVTNSP